MSDSEVEATARDYAMARAAAAITFAEGAIEALKELIAMFVTPEDDRGGTGRSELISDALDLLGSATRAVESAETAMPQVDPAEGEPWVD